MNRRRAKQLLNAARAFLQKSMGEEEKKLSNLRKAEQKLWELEKELTSREQQEHVAEMIKHLQEIDWENKKPEHNLARLNKALAAIEKGI